MKKTYSEMPESLKGNYADVSRAWGFCWKEFVMTVPSPMFLVTPACSPGPLLPAPVTEKGIMRFSEA